MRTTTYLNFTNIGSVHFNDFNDSVRMGNIYTYLTRPIRSFNIENRAQRIIAKDKPTPAPQHASVTKQKELADKLHPNFMEEHYKKNVQLDDRLKSVYVTSTNPMEVAKPITSTRPLPEKGSERDEYDFSYYDAIKIPAGKCSLNQALTFLTNHSQNSDVYTAEKIAAEYKLDKEVVESILKHFLIPTYKDQTTSQPSEDNILVLKT